MFEDAHFAGIAEIFYGAKRRNRRDVDAGPDFYIFIS
jgi:hypothetical protein